MKEVPNIAELAAMEDGELMEVLGLAQQLQDAKSNLDKMAQLKGKARKIAEQKVKDMLTPKAYPSEFGWILEDAQRQARGGKDEMMDASPAAVL